MPDLTNKYHIITYEEGKELDYSTFETLKEVFQCLVDFSRIENSGGHDEFREFTGEVNRMSYFWSESYADNIITTSFVVDAERYQGVTVYDLPEMEQLKHKQIHLHIEKKLNRRKSLKSLLDG